MPVIEHPPEFLPIEEKCQWYLTAGQIYDPIAADHIAQLIDKVRETSNSASTFGRMVHNGMDERKVIMAETQKLHVENVKLRDENIRLQQLLNQIMASCFQTLQSATNHSAQQLQQQQSDQGLRQVRQQKRKLNAVPAPISPETNRLYLGIHFGSDACPVDAFPFQALKQTVKQDKTGETVKFLYCPNCDGEFKDRRGDGKECGLLLHLRKLKCAKLKHLRPVTDRMAQNEQNNGDNAAIGANEQKGKKQKKQKSAPSETETATAVHSLLDNEMEGTVIREDQRVSPSNSGHSSPAGIQENTSLQNIINNIKAN